MAKNFLGEFPTEVNKTPQEWVIVFIEHYSQVDGSHHKTWLIDQIARILNGTPVVTVMAKWGPSQDYPEGFEELRFYTGEPSKSYEDWVNRMKGDVDCEGNFEYDYDEGIAP